MRPFHLLAFAAVLLPTLSLFASRGMAPLFLLTLVGVIGLHAKRYGTLPRLPEGLLPILLGFFAFGGITLVWSIESVLTLREWAASLGYVLGGLFLVSTARDMPEQDRARLFPIVVVALAVGLGVLLFEGMSESFLNRWFKGIEADPNYPGGYVINMHAVLSNGASLLALLLPVVCAALWRSGWRISAFGLGGLGLIALSYGASSSTQGALALGGGLWVLAGQVGVRRAAGAFIALFVLVSLATPLAAGQLNWRDFEYFRREGVMAHVPNSGIHRLVISAFTAEKITERPFLGWGFGTSRAIPGGNAVLTVRDVLGQGDKAMPPEIAGMNFLPLHPHNYALQWTLELGVVGLVLGLWVVTAAVRRMAVLLPIPSAGGAVLAQVGVWWGVSALSYGAWQGWWLGAVALVCAITAALIREEEATR